MPDLYFGKKPARLGSIKFQFGNYVSRVVDVPPGPFGHISNNISWGMLGNDEAGCCVVAGGAHEEMVWHRATKRPVPQFTVGGILQEYRRASGWNGVRDDRSDVGLDMQTYAERRRTVGIPDSKGVRHKIMAYAAVQGLYELIQATYLFGSCGAGFRMPSTAASQFAAGRPWTVVPGADVVGGHYVCCVGRNKNGHLVFVTWGRLQAATPEFVQTYMDEAVAYISPDYIDPQTGLTPEAIDEARLKADLAALSA